MQLRFASFAVINLREDLHLQEYARAGRTVKKPLGRGFGDAPIGPSRFNRQTFFASTRAVAGLPKTRWL
jgi:hypothetical protein